MQTERQNRALRKFTDFSARFTSFRPDLLSLASRGQVRVRLVLATSTKYMLAPRNPNRIDEFAAKALFVNTSKNVCRSIKKPVIEWFNLTCEIVTKFLDNIVLHTNSIVFFCQVLTITH